MGVSSAANTANARRMSSLICEDTLEYTGEYKAAEDVREVNHSPRESRLTRGM